MKTGGAHMRPKRCACWLEQTVRCAPLQMAARETGFGAVEAYMHQGKLLALDLIVRVRGS